MCGWPVVKPLTMNLITFPCKSGGVIKYKSSYISNQIYDTQLFSVNKSSFAIPVRKEFLCNYVCIYTITHVMMQNTYM